MSSTTSTFERAKKAVDDAWAHAAREALDPQTDTDDQDLEVEIAHATLRPLLRHLKLDDELRELDAAWGDAGELGLRRKVAHRSTGTWVYCSILDLMGQILTRVELDLQHQALGAPAVETSPPPVEAVPHLPFTAERCVITARNFYGLRDLRLPLCGVSLLVGANGAGKTTALLLLKLLRFALDRGLPEAVGVVLGGTHGLKHRDAAEHEPIELGVQLDDLRWTIQLRPDGATVAHLTEETLCDGDREVFHRDALGNFVHGDRQLRSDNRLGLRAVLDSQVDDPAVTRMVACLRSISVFHDPDLHALRGGSSAALSTQLLSRGDNAITMLRAWHQRRPDRQRFAFVLTGLRAAFPGLIEDLDFVEAGSTLAARVFRPGREAPEPMRNEANGVLAMLVLLCDLAAADDGGIVAIDEPEAALHPFAIRTFARFAARAARKRGLRVILATHSPVLLDAFDGSPEQIYVLERSTWPGPTPLTQLKNPDWLRQFRLGELLADGELGSNDERG
ncbi:AAA family ATPase [Enhygromyxa salina]|uniref:AAA family ATPase n=1 Tax=Enhygromyxa salina TaxID=215803 RepID=UPI0011B214BA|nr:AAA family ATPase [Enhygromyxa salina]